MLGCCYRSPLHGFLCSACCSAARLLLQGLFERHKLIVATQLCMAVLRSRGELQRAKFEFLLRGPKEMGVDNPLTDWVSESVWGSVQALKELEDYSSLPDDLVGSSKRWREWMELERPGEQTWCVRAALVVVNAPSCLKHMSGADMQPRR